MNNQKGLTPGAHHLIPIRLWINGLKWAKAWWRLCQRYHKPRVLKISFISVQCHQSPRVCASNSVILTLLLWNSRRLSIFSTWVSETASFSNIYFSEILKTVWSIWLWSIIKQCRFHVLVIFDNVYYIQHPPNSFNWTRVHFHRQSTSFGRCESTSELCCGIIKAWNSDSLASHPWCSWWAVWITNGLSSEPKSGRVYSATTAPKQQTVRRVLMETLRWTAGCFFVCEHYQDLAGALQLDCCLSFLCLVLPCLLWPVWRLITLMCLTCVQLPPPLPPFCLFKTAST